MSLYTNLFYSNDIIDLLSDERFVAQRLRFEAALASAQAQQGIVPPTAAQVIAECCRVELLDLDRLRQDIGNFGSGLQRP